MVAIKVSDVVSPRHVQSFAYRDAISTTRLRTETYGGWIAINFGDSGSTTRRGDITSFLPIESNTINTYEDSAQILGFTVSAAPSSVADDDDEANVAALADATLLLRPQAFAGIAGSPLCLVFKARIGVHKGIVSAITYQVTVQSRIGESKDGTLPRIQLRSAQIPR
ncbi:hypothetical protein [Hoyosella altamirensis]|uniref:Uncharacterized protein n=1 Tax=Hoyosella altamirensis TaxID=616997 RepID=A0A839RUJ6_9ACTN|nr:hypothetical protein [Hoyosella altamirensis]MBB3039734.1 hypothetical protein [Hoyosella altamirensis]